MVGRPLLSCNHVSLPQAGGEKDGDGRASTRPVTIIPHPNTVLPVSPRIFQTQDLAGPETGSVGDQPAAPSGMAGPEEGQTGSRAEGRESQARGAHLHRCPQALGCSAVLPASGWRRWSRACGDAGGQVAHSPVYGSWIWAIEGRSPPGPEGKVKSTQYLPLSLAFSPLLALCPRTCNCLGRSEGDMRPGQVQSFTGESEKMSLKVSRVATGSRDTHNLPAYQPVDQRTCPHWET